VDYFSDVRRVGGTISVGDEARRGSWSLMQWEFFVIAAHQGHTVQGYTVHHKRQNSTSQNGETPVEVHEEETSTLMT